MSPNRIMKPPNSNHDVLLVPVTGSADSTLAGGGTGGGTVVEGVVGGAGDRLATDVVVLPGSVVVVVDDVLVDEVLVDEVLVDEVLVVSSVVVVVLDELVVGASVVDVVVDDVVVDDVVDDEVLVVSSVVVVVLDELVVGASVVDVVVDEVVLDEVVVESSVVDVVDVSVPHPHVCERLNFGLPPLGVISADDPDTSRSVRADPFGTATNTLSCWTPFLMIADPLTVYAGLVDPRLRVIDVKANAPLLGAITKCQYAMLVSAGHWDRDPADAVLLWRATVCVGTGCAEALPGATSKPATIKRAPPITATIPIHVRPPLFVMIPSICAALSHSERYPPNTTTTIGHSNHL